MLQFYERVNRMKKPKAPGSSCRNCKVAANTIARAATDAGAEIELEKIADFAEIMGFGVMSTPGVVVDGEVVQARSVPGRTQYATRHADSPSEPSPAIDDALIRAWIDPPGVLDRPRCCVRCH
jgi:hypothetical protein